MWHEMSWPLSSAAPAYPVPCSTQPERSTSEKTTRLGDGLTGCPVCPVSQETLSCLVSLCILENLALCMQVSQDSGLSPPAPQKKYLRKKKGREGKLRELIIKAKKVTKETLC